MILRTGLDRGEVSPEDLEKLKLLVPKAFEDFVVRKCCNRRLHSNVICVFLLRIGERNGGPHRPSSRVCGAGTQQHVLVHSRRHRGDSAGRGELAPILQFRPALARCARVHG